MSDEHGREPDESGAVEDAREKTTQVSARETTTQSDAREATQVDTRETRPRLSEASARARRRLALIVAFLCAASVALILYLGYNARLRARLSEQASRVKEVITGQPALDPYAEAVLKVEEDRGEEIGRKAEAEIPSELKQYAEAKRFLAVQEEAAREAGLSPPHDFAELAAWVREGRLLEAPRLGRGYVLYGVGLAATGLLTHYDSERGKSVPLFADDAGLKSHTEGLTTQRTQLEGELKETNEKLKAVDKRDKQTRAQLNSDAKAERKEIASVEDSLKSLKLYYATQKERAALFAEYETLASLARDFGGRAYDLNDLNASKEFQARLLTYVRPAALAVMEELGTAYQKKFGRPLPITSLIRTEEYQRTLREAGNANAGSFRVEPHTTGLAFDVYYHFMSGAEQQFVMDEIARLEREGRVEALRELRDHYHVFAFADGKRPDDKSVDDILKGGARDREDSKEKPASAPAPSRVKKGARHR